MNVASGLEPPAFDLTGIRTRDTTPAFINWGAASTTKPVSRWDRNRTFRTVQHLSSSIQ